MSKLRWLWLLLVVLSSAALSDWQATDARVAELARGGRWQEALVAAQQLVEEARTEHGPDSPEMATSLNTLGVIYLKTGNRGEAGARMVESLRIREKALGPEHAVTAFSLYNLGNLAETAQDWPLAESYLVRCLEIREKRLGPFHDLTRAVLRHLERVARAQHHDEKAREYGARLLGGPPRATPEASLGDPGQAMVAYRQARAAEDEGRYDEASRQYQQTLLWAAGHQRLAGEPLAEIARMALQVDLARLRRQLRLPADAGALDRLLQQTLEDYSRLAALEPTNPCWLYLQAVVYAAAGDASQARPLLEQAARLPAPARVLTRIQALRQKLPGPGLSRLHDPAWLTSLAENPEEFTAGQANPSTAAGIPDWERRAREAEANGDSSAASRFRAGLANTDDMERYW